MQNILHDAFTGRRGPLAQGKASSEGEEEGLKTKTHL